MAHQKRKPSPHQAAAAAFSRVCGIASAPWGAVAAAIAADLKASSYLRDRTIKGAQNAEEAVRQALRAADIIPLGGDIDGAHRDEVAELALQALADAGLLTDKAVKRINERGEEI